MFKRRRYNISVEDESRLEKVFEFSASAVYLMVMAFVAVIVIAMIGVLFFSLSPARKIMPGFISEDRRLTIEEQHLRLDSLLENYDINESYIRNIKKVINTERDIDSLSTQIKKISVIDNPDSLLMSSAEEREFINGMREKELLNASVVSPPVPVGIIFSPVSPDCVMHISNNSKADIMVPYGSHIGAIADGVVISVDKSFKPDQLTSVVIQHSHGFISRYSRLLNTIVTPGEHLIAGQAVALPFNKAEDNTISLELWHEGQRLNPSDYIFSPSQPHIHPIIDKDIGRGKL